MNKYALTLWLIIGVTVATGAIMLLTKNPNTESTTEKGCHLPQDALYGDWVYPGGSVPALPAITLNSDSTFRNYDAGSDRTAARGHWFYDSDKRTIKLSADLEDNNWSGVLKTDLSVYSEVVDYDYESKSITFKVAIDKNSDNSECGTQKLSINMFNVILFKQ